MPFFPRPCAQIDEFTQYDFLDLTQYDVVLYCWVNVVLALGVAKQIY